MAKFKWFNGNQGIYNYEDLNDFKITAYNNNGLTAVFDEADQGPYDASETPWRIRFVFEDAESFSAGGQTLFTAGTIKEVRYFNKDNDLILKIDGLDVSLPYVSAAIANEGGTLDNNIADVIWAGGHIFNGSADSSGPDNDWDGDDIATGVGNDIVNAGAGDDYIKDAGGKDIYRGGAGDGDNVSYDQVFWSPERGVQGIVADLKNGFAIGWDGLRDKLVSIEGIRGTHLDDIIRGDGKNNYFMGYQGDDILNGRGGFDVVSYRRDDDRGGIDGITGRLDKGFVVDAFGSRDKLVNIEGIEGSRFDDVIRDNAKGNYLDGQDGDDILRMHRGDDVARGGDGADRFVFRGNDIGDNEIRDFSQSEGDQIIIQAAGAFEDLDLSDVDDGVLVEHTSGSVFVDGWSEADLSAADFGY